MSIPYSFGKQWQMPGGAFSRTATSAHAGGISSARWPVGVFIEEIVWQSSIKVAPHEVLFHLVVAPEAQNINEPGRIILLSTHHISETLPTMVVKRAAPVSGLQIPPGWWTWVYGEGTDNLHPAGAEVQFTLFCKDSVPVEIQ